MGGTARRTVVIGHRAGPQWRSHPWVRHSPVSWAAAAAAAAPTKAATLATLARIHQLIVRWLHPLGRPADLLWLLVLSGLPLQLLRWRTGRTAPLESEPCCAGHSR